MYGTAQTSTPRQWPSVKFGFVIITITLTIASNFAISVADDTLSIRNERAAVVFADQGNTLYDNGTLVFDAAMNEDVEVYLLGDEEYGWEGLGDRAAGWVRNGVVMSVPPSEVIALLKKHLMADEFDIPSTVKEVLVVEMPVIITSFMLIVMAVIMPIVGLIFCCCRCAGKCGGTRKEEDLVSMGTTCGVVVGVLLIVVCAFIGTLSYLTKPSIVRMVETVDHTTTVANNILDDVETFKEDFIEDLRQVGIEDLRFVTGAVNAKLGDVGKEVASSLLRDTAPYLSALSESVENLSVELTSFTSDGSALDMVLDTSVSLVLAGQSLVDALDIAKDDLTTIRDDCLANPSKVAAGACDHIPDPTILDTSSMDFSTINIDGLDLDDLRNEMQSALATIRDLIATMTLFEEVSMLNASLDGLEIVAEEVSGSVSNLADFIQNEAGPIVIQALEAYIDGILSLADQFIDEVLRRIQDDMGRCGIIRNIYDAIVGSLCLYFLPGLNVFWFALSAISFALIPNIVFNVRLAKYLRRPTHAAPREAPFNGVAVYPTPTGTPQSSIRGSPASMRRRLSESLVNIRIPRSMASKLPGSESPGSSH